MCTAVAWRANGLYFGRNLDYDRSFGESVVVTPRKYAFCFTDGERCDTHYAIIGVAHVMNGYPLYYDAVNESGLYIAGLNFTKSAVYDILQSGKTTVAQYELIPYLLSRCGSVREAREMLEAVTVSAVSFCGLPPSKLHWMIADERETAVIEQTADGLHIYDNPVGVLTNEPPFPYQMFSLNNYMSISARPPKNELLPNIKLDEYSRGMGGIGLPGDYSSQSRFVRAAFVCANSVVGSEKENVSQFFHILSSVEQVKGGCIMADGKYEFTLYSSCCDVRNMVYHYTTYYGKSRVEVGMKSHDLSGRELAVYPVEL